MSHLLACNRPGLRKDQIRKNPTLFKRGLTLVELLVVIIVSLLVVGVALTVYQVNVRYYVQQDSLLEQTQNLRVGMYTVARDVRMAGNCFTLLGANVERIQVFLPAVGTKTAGWFRYSPSSSTYGAMAIFGQDGGSSGTDTLTVFRADIESASPVGSLSNSYTPGGSEYRLDFITSFEKGTLEAGDIVALVSGSNAMVLEAGSIDESSQSYAVIGDRFKPSLGQTFPGGSFSFPRGTQVYNLRDITLVTYKIDSDLKALVADYHDYDIMNENADKDGQIIVANNIEDFQVRYWLGSPFTTPAKVTATDGVDSVTEGQFLNGANWIRAVNMAMVAVSPTVDSKRGLSSPPQLYNHTGVGSPDQRLRRSLSETVYLRNYE